jgi:hypothetical protein
MCLLTAVRRRLLFNNRTFVLFPLVRARIDPGMR